jgi:hypothetical protein
MCCALTNGDDAQIDEGEHHDEDFDSQLFSAAAAESRLCSQFLVTVT